MKDAQHLFFQKVITQVKNCLEPDVKIESGLLISVGNVIKMLIRSFMSIMW